MTSFCIFGKVQIENKSLLFRLNLVQAVNLTLFRLNYFGKIIHLQRPYTAKVMGAMNESRTLQPGGKLQSSCPILRKSSTNYLYLRFLSFFKIIKFRELYGDS